MEDLRKIITTKTARKMKRPELLSKLWYLIEIAIIIYDSGVPFFLHLKCLRNPKNQQRRSDSPTKGTVGTFYDHGTIKTLGVIYSF